MKKWISLVFLSILLIGCSDIEISTTDTNGQEKLTIKTESKDKSYKIVDYQPFDDVEKQEGIFTLFDYDNENNFIIKIPLSQIQTRSNDIDGYRLYFYYENNEELERMKRGEILETDVFKIKM